MLKVKMITYYSLLFIINTQSVLLQAQSENQSSNYPNVIPPDPISAEFQKYLGYPVSHATGLPQINIPLYTMNAGNMSIPFSLSYHASGIKVEQQMGIIGLGWSLFPGCKITRTIMGKPDDQFPTNDIRDLNTYDWNSAQVHRTTPNGDPIAPFPIFDYLYNITPHSQDNVMFWPSGLSGTQGYSDTQHDIFTLHLPNKNVSFILEWENDTLKATTIPASPIKIEMVGANSRGQFSSFEVTDENGVFYTFAGSGGDVEYNDEYDFVSSWFLKTIDPPGADNTITFNYNPLEFTLSENTHIQTAVLKDEETISGSSGLAYNPNPVVTYNNSFNTQQFNTKTIASISYQTGENILFQYSNLPDHMYGSSLDKITFKNKNDVVIKTIDLECVDKQLKKLTISGDGAYEFVYDQQDMTPPPGEPYIGRDFLGLFNGKFAVSSGVPHMNLYYDTHQQGGILAKEVGHINPTFDPVTSQARILKNIIYPTGGQTSFEYEPNQYREHDGTAVCGMGLRIKKINTYDPVSNKTITKSYTYGQNESGIGICTSPYINTPSGEAPPYDHEGQYTNAYITQQFYLGLEYHYRIRTVGPTAKTGITTEPIIWYDQVTEYSNEGKTIYNYEFERTKYTQYTDGGWEGYFRAPTKTMDEFIDTKYYFPEIYRNIGNSAPRLTSTEIKDGNDNTLQHTTYTYSNEKRNILGVYSRIAAFHDGYLINTIPIYPEADDQAQVGALADFLKGDNYWLEISNDKLIATTQTDYRNAKEVVTQTTFEYDDTYAFNLKSKTVATSDGGAYTEKYYYPVGEAVPDLNSLSLSQKNTIHLFSENKNYHGLVIEKETFKNSTLLSKELYGYNDFGNSIYKLENPYSKKGTYNFESPYTLSYDEKGNIATISKTNGTQTHYIWGYNQQYPIAKIENINAIQANSIGSLIDIAIDNSDIDNDRTLDDSGTEGNLRASLDVIRNDASLTNALITSYTYDPLIGITSTTDPKGNVLYYNYDADFKLKTIKDQNGKLVEQYKYNYIPFGTYDPIPVPAYSGDLACGSGQTFIPFEGGGTPGGGINGGNYSISLESHDFGQNQVGSSNSMLFTITNTTSNTNNTSITIDNINIPDGFTVNGYTHNFPPMTVFKDTPKDIVVAFTPTEAKVYSGTISFGGNVAGPNITVEGEGISATDNGTRIMDIRHNGVSTYDLDFGTISDQESIAKTLEIHNTGNTTLTVSSFTNSNYPTFFPINLDAFPYSIAPGDSFSFGIELIPNGAYTSGQTIYSTITFDSDKTSGSNVIQLSGTIEEN